MRWTMAHFIVKKGLSSKTKFDITADSMTIGRDPKNDIHLSDQSISRKHAIIHRLPNGGFEIQDVGSTSGTVVDGKKTVRAHLANGSIVILGQAAVLQFVQEESALSQAKPIKPPEADAAGKVQLKDQPINAPLKGERAPIKGQEEKKIPAFKLSSELEKEMEVLKRKAEELKKSAGSEKRPSKMTDYSETFKNMEEQKGLPLFYIIPAVLCFFIIVSGLVWYLKFGGNLQKEKAKDDGVLRFRITFNKNQTYDLATMLPQIEHLGGRLPPIGGDKSRGPDAKMKVVVEIDEVDGPPKSKTPKKKSKIDKLKDKKNKELAFRDLGDSKNLDITLIDKRKNPKYAFTPEAAMLGDSKKLSGLPDVKQKNSDKLPIDMKGGSDGSPQIPALASGPFSLGRLAKHAVDTESPCVFNVLKPSNESLNYPSVAINDVGAFIVVWQAKRSNERGYEIFGRRFNEKISGVGEKFLVASVMSDMEIRPSVAMSNEGNFIVVWDDISPDGASSRIVGKRYYDERGEIQTDELAIKSESDTKIGRPVIAMKDNGSFLVIWQVLDKTGRAEETRGRVFASSAEPIGDEFQISTMPYKDWVATIRHEEQFVLAWQIESQTANKAYLGDQSGEQTSDDFVLLWSAEKQKDEAFGVVGPRLDLINLFWKEGSPVARLLPPDRYMPTLAAKSGEAVVIWIGYDKEKKMQKLVGQRYDATGELICSFSRS